MADQGKWFKLWCSSLNDPDLGNLDIADFGRWVKFGLFLKVHGTKGKIHIEPPAKVLCSHLQVENFDALKKCFKCFPNCQITRDDDVTIDVTEGVTVSFKNWFKYQIDSSTERMRRKRMKDASFVTTKKRREEKRRDKENIIKEKEVFGSFKNILLEKKEYDSLVERFGYEVTLNKIENLSEGIASKGYKYKDHYATILSWDRKEKRDNPKEGGLNRWDAFQAQVHSKKNSG